MISLIIPGVFFLLLLVLVIAFFKKKWWLIALFVISMVLLNNSSGCFCFGFKNSDFGDLKVLSFNVKGSGVCEDNKVSSIIGIFQKEQPDIIFLTENFKPLDDSLYEWLHSHYVYDTQLLPHNVIYSKHPIHNVRCFMNFCRGNSFVIECSTIVKGNVLTLYGCHLSSNNYSIDLEYLTPNKVNSWSSLKTYYKNMSNAFVQREIEVDSIVKYCSDTKRVIVMGDMNDVCGAPSMQLFKRAGFNDAWSVGGFGYGATIHSPLPYRIDHILFNNGLTLKGIKKINARGISDHDALVAVFDFE